MDFSMAQSNAFCHAFADVFRELGDHRSWIDLKETAGTLLRGCKVHFRTSVNRIAKLSAVVAPNHKAAFIQLATGLLDCTSPAEFNEGCEEIKRQFPGATNWITWWRRPNVASKLFEGMKTMDPQLWESAPSTTNAEEAMHSKMYAHIGRGHQLLAGLRRLFQLERMFSMMHAHAASMWYFYSLTVSENKPKNRWPVSGIFTRVVEKGRTRWSIL